MEKNWGEYLFKNATIIPELSISSTSERKYFKVLPGNCILVLMSQNY